MARTKTFNETEVIDKAIRLFTAKGYNSTSAQDIVDTLAISRSSLYDTFGDKEGLFIKALEQYNLESFGKIIMLLKQTSDFPATIREIFKMIIRQNLQGDFESGCLMINSAAEISSHNPDVGTLIRGSMRSVEDALFTAISKAQKQKLVSDKYSARSLASFFFNTFIGLRVMAKAGGRKKTFQDIVNLSLSVLG